MNTNIATAGYKGDKVKSDCFISLELTNSGGIQLEVISKVESLYGEAIRHFCQEILEFFKIENALVKLEDKGALPFVIAARLEAAIKKLLATDKEFLLEMLEVNKAVTTRDRFRISRFDDQCRCTSAKRNHPRFGRCGSG